MHACISRYSAGAIKFTLKGLAIMKGSVDHCQVLYAMVDDTSRLDLLGGILMRELILKGYAGCISIKVRSIKIPCDLTLLVALYSDEL